jgi:ribosomal-protein-alanine N-acetyltransferase
MAKNEVGQVVGFAVACLYPALPDSAVLESVCVAMAARRTGIGGALCEAVIDWCRSQSATEIGLEVRAESAGARALYTSVGFVRTALRPAYYAYPLDDAVILRKNLAGS